MVSKVSISNLFDTSIDMHIRGYRNLALPPEFALNQALIELSVVFDRDGWELDIGFLLARIADAKKRSNIESVFPGEIVPIKWELTNNFEYEPWVRDVKFPARLNWQIGYLIDLWNELEVVVLP